MLVLYVLLAVLLVLFVLALLRIRVSLALHGTGISVTLHILFLRFPLYSKPQKVRLSDYTYKKQQKRLQKKKASAPAAHQTASKGELKKNSPLHDIRLYFYILKRCYRYFLHAFRMDISRLHITVATKDPAQTAILYGAVAQTVAYTVELLETHIQLNSTYRPDIQVIPDFSQESCQIDCYTSFSLRVYQILVLGTRAAWYFLKGKANKKSNIPEKTTQGGHPHV